MEYEISEKECAKLWNIATNCAIKSFNLELSDQQIQKQIDRFSKK